MDTSLRIKQVLIILLTASFAFQRSVSAASVRAGLSDILIGILFGYVCISFIFTGKKSLFPLPPVYVLLSICAVVLSGAVASYSGGGMGILKEEIQTIGILGIGWIILSFLLEKEQSRADLMMRVLIITAGAEAAVSLVLQSVQGNLFYTGFLTRNRNTYSMLVMTCAPVIGWYAAAESRKRYACIYSTILILVFSAVLSAGALAGGLAGVGALLICRKHTGKLLLFACIPALIGTGIVCIRTEGGRALRASIVPNVRENFLVKQRGPEHTQRKEALIGTAPQWFADHTAVRYRRWRYAFKHAGESFRKLLVGSGPSSFNEALKPYSAAEGSPNIDTDEISMFNIGVNEPDTFSAYTVWLAGYGVIGLAALAALLFVPAIRGLANGQGPSAAAGAALLALAVCDLFHAHTITGMYSMAAALIYCAAADFSHTGPSVQEYPDD